MVRSLAADLWFPGRVTLIIPKTRNTVYNPPIDYLTVYVDNFRAGLHISLLPLLLDLLIHYDITLSQLVPSAIQAIVGFEKLCR